MKTKKSSFELGKMKHVFQSTSVM